MAIRAEVDEARGRVHADAIRGGRRSTVDPDDAGGRGAAGRLGDAARRPGPGAAGASWCGRTVGMTDSDFPSISVLNRASLDALGANGSGRPLAMERFRGNVWLDGLEPFGRVRPGRARDPDRRRGARRCASGSPAASRPRSIPRPASSDADTLGGARGRLGAPRLRGLCRGRRGRPRRGRATAAAVA